MKKSNSSQVWKELWSWTISCHNENAEDAMIRHVWEEASYKRVDFQATVSRTCYWVELD